MHSHPHFHKNASKQDQLPAQSKREWKSFGRQAREHVDAEDGKKANKENVIRDAFLNIL